MQNCCLINSLLKQGKSSIAIFSLAIRGYHTSKLVNLILFLYLKVLPKFETMSDFLQNISFQFSSVSLPWGGCQSCELKPGECTLNYISREDMMASTGELTWNIRLQAAEEQALEAALLSIIEKAPLQKESSIVLDGSPTNIKIKYKNKTIEHHWNSRSDHDVINALEKLVSDFSNKPHTKKKLKSVLDFAK